MKTQAWKRWAPLKLLILPLIFSTNAYSQSGGFEYTYGGENYDTDGVNLEVAKDRSVFTTATWYNSTISDGGVIVHKLSATGVLQWKTILESAEGAINPAGIYELPDSTLIVLVNVFKPVLPAGESSMTLIRLDKNGRMITYKGFSNKGKTLSAGALVGAGNHFYAIGNSMQGDTLQTTIQRFDQNLNKLSSVTLDSVFIGGGLFSEHQLLLTGMKNPARPIPVLLKLDTLLNVSRAVQYPVDHADCYFAMGRKIITDQGMPFIIGDYESASGLAKRFLINTTDLAGSIFVSGDFIQDLSVKNNELYVLANLGEATSSGQELYAAKYNLLTRSKRWAKGYGNTGTEMPLRMTVSGDRIYMLGVSQSYSGRTNTRGLPVSETYVLQADTSGNTGCHAAVSGDNAVLAQLRVNGEPFSPARFVNDTGYFTSFTVTTPAFYDSLACSPAATRIITTRPEAFIVYPTLTRGKVYIKGTISPDLVPEIMAINGQKLTLTGWNLSDHSFDISHLPDAMYLIRITDPETKSSTVHKIFKAAE